MLLILIVRGAGVDRGGLYFQALALVSGASILCSLGGAMTITRLIAQIRRNDDVDASASVWTTVLPVAAFSTVVAIIGYTTSGDLAELLTSPTHREALAALLAGMVLSVPFVVLTRVFTAISRAVDEPAAGAWYDLGGQPVLRVVGVSAVLSAGAGDTALAWTITGPAVICCALAAVHSFGSLRRAGIYCSVTPTWNGRERAQRCCALASREASRKWCWLPAFGC